MSARHRKVCILGATGAGKTSLVRRFVESIFSEHYHPTLGVKVDRRNVTVGDHAIDLMLWDLQGETGTQRTRIEHLRGADGYLVVADHTRPESLELALDLARRAAEIAPAAVPVVAINKCDLRAETVISDGDLEPLAGRGWRIVRTSARTGAGVDQLFRELAERLLTSTAPVAESP